MTSAGGRADRRRRRRRRQRLRVAAIIGGTALVMGTVVGAAFAFPELLSAPEPTPEPSREPLPTAGTPSPVATPSPTPNPTPSLTLEPAGIDKAIVLVVENHSASQMKAGAPRLTALAQKYGDAPKAVAPCGHPSQPNYVCLSAGGRYLGSNDIKTLSQPDIWNNTLKAGRTMKVYADNLPGNVNDRRKDIGRYAGRHVFTVPFVSTKEKANNFARYTVDANTLAADVQSGSLPNVGAIIPDNCHNAHDRCGSEGPTKLKQADNWISDQVELMQSGPDWKSGQLLIIVTADEDDKNGVNDIPMIVIHPSLDHKVTDVPLDLYSVGGLLADLGHTDRLGKQRTAPDFAKAFGLTLATAASPSPSASPSAR